ncbi:type IVB secretion system protein IcmH/DotU [Massilia sp. PAMC28688]|uniref:type IVB secretion system protein IcmH/DotU n=1 Tax=Massilia sp. PAMC28688 TaxID=2861283 RepID=UPI001C630790|nr:type IVB secretion system protein IcmH/DotU [Massilia sp. PAMC28688]QYF95738.1 type IVB secretion system protein IcmH/DotU [Massilia sp. PAMC28688]
MSTQEPGKPEQDPARPQPDPDATMLILNPGGRRPAPAPAGGAGPAAPAASAHAATPHTVLAGSGLNRLVRAADPLLDLVVPLRHTMQPPDLGQLRERLALAIRTFEADAAAAGVPAESIAAARYALCTLLDETIAGTAWGSGVWGTRSLLVAFHNEASGGEKFFLVLQRLSQDPARHLDLLELMYLCLALGLEGRFRMADQGQAQLTQLRERLLQLIRQHRGAVDSGLSPHWRGAAAPVAAPLRSTPVWVAAAAVCVLLLGAQLAASVALNRSSDPVFARLSALRQAAPSAPAPVQAAAGPSRLSTFLAPEVAAGRVSVNETPGRTTITLHGEGMFGSGSAAVDPAMTPLLNRIGEALKTLPGKVQVIGHTDNTRPGLSARYPSNYDLSKARAASVMAMLAAQAGPPERYSAEGRGDAAPLTSNDSPAGRARNRRVDLVVLAPASAP